MAMKRLAGMLIVVAFLAAPLLAENASAAQQQWALATTGVLTELNGRRHDLLGEMEPSAASRAEIQSQLSEWWGIDSREELIAAIGQLRSRPNGWDLIRSITLCRWGYQVHFLTEQEAWDEIMPIARTLQGMFSSWRELGRSYLSRRELWTGQMRWDRDAARGDLHSLFRELLFFKTSPWRRTTLDRMARDLSTTNCCSDAYADYAYRRLLFDEASPWRRIPWNLDLGGEPHAPVAASSSTLAGLELISRPAGLTCFSLTLVDRHPSASLIPDLEKVAGCRARVIADKDYGNDWYAAGDCVRPGLAHGAKVSADYPLEPLAARLRAEGVTELFYNVSHAPAGSSFLSPGAPFHWINEGMEYDVGSWDLGSPLAPLRLKYGFGLGEASQFYIPGLIFSVGVFALVLWRKKAYRVAHWAGWTLLVTSTNAIAIVRLTMGLEGLGGDISAVGVLLLLPLLVEVASGPFVRPEFDAPRAWRAALWSNLMVVPFAGLALTIADLQGGLNLPTIFVAVVLAFMILAFCLRNYFRVLGVAGAAVNEGDLRDRIVTLAKTVRVPVRRFCVIPAGAAPVGVFAPGDGSLLISAELIQALSKREVEALALRALVGRRSGETHKRSLASVTLAGAVFLGSSWFVYWLGRVGTLLLIFLGLSLAAWALVSLWRFWQTGGDRRAAAALENPEALISALMRIGNAARARRLAQSYGIDENQFHEAAGPAVPIVERYTVPMLTGPAVYSPV
jgi:hypothetical protein